MAHEAGEDKERGEAGGTPCTVDREDSNWTIWKTSGSPVSQLARLISSNEAASPERGDRASERGRRLLGSDWHISLKASIAHACSTTHEVDGPGLPVNIEPVWRRVTVETNLPTSGIPN